MNESFETTYARLQEVIMSLEGGQVPLEESLQLYEEGVRLIRICHEQLVGARRRIELIAGQNENGEPVLQSVAEDERTLEEKSQTRGR